MAGGQETEDEILQKEAREKECFDYLKGYIKGEKPGLEKFYENDDKIKAAAVQAADLVKKLCEVDLGCTPEIARDMGVLVLYDLVMLIDDSASIHFGDGGERKKTLEKTLHAIAKIYVHVRTSGINSVRFLNGHKGKKDVRPGNVGQIIEGHAWRGVTRIGTELERKILDYFVYKEPKVKPRKLREREKPLLIMTITDGTIEGEAKNTLQSVIEDCVKHLEKPEPDGFGTHGADTVAFHFSRVGKDEDAAKLLKALDDDTRIGKYIDCLPVDEPSCLETMVSSDRLVKWNILAKLLLGAIIPSWDNYDGGLEVDPVEALIAAKEEDIQDEECGAEDVNYGNDDSKGVQQGGNDSGKGVQQGGNNSGNGDKDVQQGGNNRDDDIEDEDAGDEREYEKVD